MKNMLHLYVLCAMIFLFSSCNTSSEPLNIGHRGAMGHETENTLASIQKAMDLGVDMIEIDVFKVASGEIVVFHDENLERLSDGTGKIEEHTYKDLQKVTLKGSHKIPLLEKVLELIGNRVALNIELKGAGTTNEVNAIINKHISSGVWGHDNFLISSFKWDELRKMRSINPNIKIAVLTEENPLEAISISNQLNAVAINPDHKTLTKENVRKMKEAGLKIYPWTVNDVDAIEKMKDYEVDGIITNYPERID